VKNKPTLKKGIVAASVVAGVAGGLVAGLALGVPGFAGASSNGTQGASATFAKNAVVQLAADNGTATSLPGTITVQGANGAVDAGHAPRGPRAAVESDAVAKVLGLSTTELQTQLQSGKSLVEIAKTQNVDIAKVKQAIILDFTARETAEVAAGEHTQAEVDQKIADLKANIDDIVNGVRPAGMPGKGGMKGGPRGGAPIASDAVAKALGLTATELQTQLQSGKSLADIAKAQSVDIAKVKDAIVADITAHFADEVKSGEHTQAEVDQKLADLKTHLDDIVNGVRPAGMPGKGGDMGGMKGGPRGGAPIASDAVAKALGLTAAELQTQLQSGKSLADIAKAQSIDIAKVKDAIVTDITAHFADEVKSGEHTQAEADQKIADLKSHLDDIVNGVKPAGGPGMDGGMGHGPRGGHGGPGGDRGQQQGGGSAPTLQGSVTVQPSGANA